MYRRPCRIPGLATLALLFASHANAGLILTVAEVDLDPRYDELLVSVQITGTEGLSSIGYDLAFDGTGVGAFNLTVGPIQGETVTCPTVSGGPAPARECWLAEIGPPNPDGTGYNLATLGTGIFGGTYEIGYQLIELGTGFTLGSVSIENLVAFDDAGQAITDIGIRIVPEPRTGALLALGLIALASGGRVRDAAR